MAIRPEITKHGAEHGAHSKFQVASQGRMQANDEPEPILKIDANGDVSSEPESEELSMTSSRWHKRKWLRYQ